MKKLVLLIGTLFGCMSIHMNASFFIKVTNLINKQVDVAIKTGALCKNQGGSVAAHSAYEWDIGTWIGSCRADITVTLPNNKTFSVSTGNELYIETFVENGIYKTQYKQPRESGWHTYDLTNDASV